MSCWRRSRVGFLAVALAALMAGCSQNDTANEPGDGESISSPLVTAAPEQWDPNSWVPTVRVEPEVLSEEERWARRADWLAQDARMTDPPEVELIAWASSYAEHGQQVTDCLAKAGFPGIWNGAGGRYFDPPVPAQQEEALDLATHTCSAQYSLDPQILREWTEEQAAVMYDYWVEYYIPCMEAHGFTMNLYKESQPSREAYVAAFTGPNRIQWYPYTATQSLPVEEQQPLESTCPGMPPEQFMYGM